MASIPKLPKTEDDDPLLRKVLYQGEGSATADKEALAEARRRIAAGEDASKVRSATGWHQGAGGEWRSEIDDSRSKLRPGIAQRLLELQAQQVQQAQANPALAVGRHFLGPLVKAGTFGLVDPNDVAPSYKLGDLIDHPELAKAYPEVMNTPVAIDASLRNLGEYQWGNKISLNPRFIQLMADRKNVPFEDYLREVVLHETQHRLQHEEKWKQTREPSEPDKYRARSEEAEALDAELRRDLTAEERRQVEPGALEAVDRERERASVREAPAKRGPAEAPPPPGGSAPMRQSETPKALSPAPIRHFLGDHDDDPSHAREAYAIDQGFGSYLDLHNALLHASTPPELATYHLRAANGMVTESAPDDSEPAP
jgi:conjugative element/phage-associated large polyvalent protein